jgi:hypothetical protein
MRLKGHDALLWFSAEWWAKNGRSPIWLRISAGSKLSESVRQALVQEGAVFHVADDGYYVAIDLALGVERDDVVLRALTQVRRIAGLLPPLPASVSDPVVPASEAAEPSGV